MFIKIILLEKPILFFSSDKSIGRFYAFWNWHKSIRFNDFSKKLINEDRLFKLRKK